MKRSANVLALLLWLFLVGMVLADSAPPDDLDRQIQFATRLFDQGHAVESKKIFESLLAELQSGTPSIQPGFVLNELSKIAAATGDYKAAIQLAKQSGSAYHDVRDIGGESHSLNNEGIAEIQMGQYGPAQQTLEAALVLSRRAQDTENQVQVLNNLGSAYYFPGSYSDAMVRYDEAMALLTKTSRQNGATTGAKLLASTGRRWISAWADTRMHCRLSRGRTII